MCVNAMVEIDPRLTNVADRVVCDIADEFTDNGESDKATAILQPLAEKGFALAQHNLARAHFRNKWPGDSRAEMVNSILIAGRRDFGLSCHAVLPRDPTSFLAPGEVLAGRRKKERRG